MSARFQLHVTFFPGLFRQPKIFLQAIYSAVIVGGLGFPRNHESSTSTRAAPSVPAFQRHILQCHPASFFCELACPRPNSHGALTALRTVVSHPQQQLFTSPSQRSAPSSLLSTPPQHTNSNHNSSPSVQKQKSFINLRRLHPPQGHGGTPCPVSVQAGFTPAVLRAVLATKVAKKNSSARAATVDNHDGMAS